MCACVQVGGGGGGGEGRKQICSVAKTINQQTRETWAQSPVYLSVFPPPYCFFTSSFHIHLVSIDLFVLPFFVVVCLLLLFSFARSFFSLTL